MRILFLLNPNFLRRERREQALAWLEDFARALEAKGHTVGRFDGLTTKVRDFDVIHVFSPCEPETWSVLSGLGLPVVVTPALEPKAELRGLSRLARLARAALQRRWPPIDETFFLNSPRAFLVVSAQWIEALSEAWGIPPSKITALSSNPADAAAQALALYGAIA